MTTPSNVDAYVGAAPEPFRSLLAGFRTYGMPGFRIEGALVTGYAAFSKACGLYIDPGTMADHAEEIAAQGLEATKTGVTFSPSRPITDDLIKKLAVASRREKSV